MASHHQAVEESEGEWVKPEPWEPPIPMLHFEVCPFPTRTLPNWLRDFVEADAIAKQVPTGLPGLLSLGALATALARKVVVKIRDGWLEPVNLYVVVALPPGSRKSPQFSSIIAPIGNEEPASGIYCEVMRIVEQPALSGRRVHPTSDLHNERPIRRKFDQAVIATAMPIRDPNLAIGGDQHMGGTIEMRLIVPGDGRFAQGHQYFSLRAQLEDLVPLAEFESSFSPTFSYR